MKWITRERPKIDSIACPWLMTSYIDDAPEIVYLPAGDVMRIAAATGARPCDVPSVALGHQGDQCSVDALIAKDAVCSKAPLAWPGKALGCP